MPNPAHSLDELCILAGVPPRTVRYYIQLGLVDRPDGETRAARYTARHLGQLQQIRRWTDEGLSLERVRELFEAERNPQLPIARSRRGEVEVWSHIVLDDGVELHIEPGRAGLSPEQVRALARACQAAHAAIQSPSNKKENSR